MKKYLIALLIAAASVVFATGTETAVMLDLSRKSTTISLAFTENYDYAVRATVRNGGDDYALAGWDVNLVVGNGDKGAIYEGVIENVNEAYFNIPAYSIPTNGKYTVQIVAMKDGRSNEWGRGNLRVNLDPGINYMPTCWMGYQKVARLAASMITTEMITNDIVQAVVQNYQVKLDTSTWTNPCVRITKSFSDGVELRKYILADGATAANCVFTNGADLVGSFQFVGGVAVSNSVFRITGVNAETFLPEKIGKNWWYRSTADSTRKFMIKLSFVDQEGRGRILQGE